MEYRVNITTQEGNTINQRPIDPTEWPELIERTRARYDYILTLEQRTHFDGEEAQEFVEMNGGKENLKGYLVLPNRVITPWQTIAEVNTKYQN